MDYCDIDAPSCFKEITRTARKQHKCCECRHPIMPGDKYVYYSGVWDGEPADFKRCLICDEVAKKFSEIHDCAVCFRGLRAEFSDYQEQSDTYASLAEILGVSVEKIKHVLGEKWFDA
ncbi:hypothetical protein [Martelella alba]|uniref:Uncharacterized protein n=1 Tax=Martelella alba TaxID=2590451 RepID=A0ABY2SLB0_9HYPH|nr:hypothetical protein [Martelella alba]TKI06225.1 hypothetical protein FCN80_10280 [Martelella alba]